jgi:transposase
MKPIHVNESRFYRELTEIEKQKEKIEQWLYQTLKNRNEKSMRIIFYDLSDSYFEGRKCPIAKPGRTKANGFREKRIILSLLVNSEGYPLSWKILEDYTADVSTLTKNTDLWKQQFNFSKIIIVFDRGMVLDENLQNLERFKDFTNDVTENEILSKGLKKYDEETFYEDMGVDSSGRRHILIFNSDLLKDQRKKAEILSPRNKGLTKCLRNLGSNLTLTPNLKVSIYLEKVDHRSAALTSHMKKMLKL